MSKVKVEVYTRSMCQYCERAKDLLHKKGIEFIEYNIISEPATRQALEKRLGSFETVPQIFIDDKHVGGCDDLYALDRSGELDKLLKLE